MLRGPCLVETKAKGKKKDMVGHIISSIRCLRGAPGGRDEDKTRLKANEKSDEEVLQYQVHFYTYVARKKDGQHRSRRTGES